MEVSAQIRPGCSGGPIVDEKGRVLGISAFLKFRGVAIRDGKIVYDRSLDTARKFAVNASLIKELLTLASRDHQITLADARNAHREKEIAPALFVIDDFISKAFDRALRTRLEFKQSYIRTPDVTRHFRGSKGMTEFASEKGQVIEDHHRII